MEALGRALRLWQYWRAQVLQELPQATSAGDESSAQPPLRGFGSQVCSGRRAQPAPAAASGTHGAAAAPLRWTKLELSVTASWGALTSPFGDGPDVSAPSARGRGR